MNAARHDTRKTPVQCWFFSRSKKFSVKPASAKLLPILQICSAVGATETEGTTSDRLTTADATAKVGNEPMHLKDVSDGPFGREHALLVEMDNQLDQLREELKRDRKEWEATYNSLVTDTIGKTVSNVSTQVLQFAQGRRYTHSRKSSFMTHANLKDPRILKLARVTHMQVEALAKILDAVIARRTYFWNNIRCPDVTALDEAVEECLRYVEDFPSLTVNMSTEVWVLENYGVIKHVYRTEFK